MEARSRVCCRATSSTLLGSPITLLRPPTRGATRPRLHSTVRCSETANTQSNDLVKPVEFKRGLIVPQRLLQTGTSSLGSSKHHTVYTLRFSTGFGRGSGMDIPATGVQVCLVGRDGSAVLQRVSPLNDPVATEQDALKICQVVDKEAGADCKRVLKAASSNRARSSAVKQRFQEGSIDEISFLGPELGPLASIMVAPEEGSWRVDEITVSSSRSRHTDRFVCRDRLGCKGGVSAGFLSPVPVDSVVYGTGENAVILTREQAALLHSAGMLDYSQLKDRILITTAALVAAGSSLCYTIGGWPATEPFLAGGATGLMYQRMLQASVDNLPGSMYQKRPLLQGPAQALQNAMNSTAARLMAVAALALAAVWGLQASGTAQDDPTSLKQMLEVRQVLTGLLGFMMYKVAIVGCTAVPAAPSQRAAEGERLI